MPWWPSSSRRSAAAAASTELQIAAPPLRPIEGAPEFGGVDLLRARLEAELALPAVIAITSATLGDGKEFIARSLAHSFARSSYATLLIDSDPTTLTLVAARRGLVVPGIGRLSWALDDASGQLAVLTVTDQTLRRMTSLGDAAAAIQKCGPRSRR